MQSVLVFFSKELNWIFLCVIIVISDDQGRWPTLAKHWRVICIYFYFQLLCKIFSFNKLFIIDINDSKLLLFLVSSKWVEAASIFTLYVFNTLSATWPTSGSCGAVYGNHTQLIIAVNNMAHRWDIWRLTCN